ncbi:MAG TPA: enoyl-CoA hydratase-related protein [Vicinamibacterales bacterium]|nr:enoyl-CoA hydratase-related protein [Vicinamibacterales bacterium]
MSKVLYDTRGSIARITINRPEAMNAFDLETAALIGERLEQFDGDPALRVAIITGAGDKAFCAGADLKKMHGGSHAGGIQELWDAGRQNRLGQRLHVVKPVIAAINGYCLAGGLEFALGCDLRIASTNASFGCPEVRWSILHGFGAMRLPHTVGMSMAMEMLLTGERIDARRAYEIGLVSRLVEPAALLTTAEQMAERIAQNGPLAIRVTKELAWRGLHEHPDDMLRFYAAVTALIHETEDAKEGPRAFSEKRTPQFKNR